MDEPKRHVVAVDGDNLISALREVSSLHLAPSKFADFLRSFFKLKGRGKRQRKREQTALLWFQTVSDEVRFRSSRVRLEQAGWIVHTCPPSDRRDPVTGEPKPGMPDEEIERHIRLHFVPGVTQTMVLVSGDHHFARLVQDVRASGVKTAIVGMRDRHVSHVLKRAANMVVYLDHYLGRVLAKGPHSPLVPHS